VTHHWQHWQQTQPHAQQQQQQQQLEWQGIGSYSSWRQMCVGYWAAPVGWWPG
jgi:hypothetical protein